MIVTVTANPALDRTITLAGALRAGEVQTAVSVREDAGGKGVNVSRVLSAAGVATLAVLPVAADDPYAAVIRAAGVPVRTVPVERHVRTNLALTDAVGETTKINLVGAPLTDTDARALTDAVVAATEGADWLVLAGSLPAGVADTYYVEIVDAVRERWGAEAPRIAVDTSGPALRAVVESRAADLIKPNDEELAELAGAVIDVDSPRESVRRIAQRIVPEFAASALVTLGGAGAALVTAEEAWFVAAPRIRVASTVGAGDSSLAGYLLAERAGVDPAERLRSAVRHGSAAAALPGTRVPAPADLGPAVSAALPL